MPFKRTGTVRASFASLNSGEQRRLLRSADHMLRQRPGCNPAALIEFAELRHRLLNDAPADTNAAHQAPIAMKLPVLLASRVAQIHAPFKPMTWRKKTAKVATTLRNQPRAVIKRLICFTVPNSN